MFRFSRIVYYLGLVPVVDVFPLPLVVWSAKAEEIATGVLASFTSLTGKPYAKAAVQGPVGRFVYYSQYYLTTSEEVAFKNELTTKLKALNPGNVQLEFEIFGSGLKSGSLVAAPVTVVVMLVSNAGSR